MSLSLKPLRWSVFGVAAGLALLAASAADAQDWKGGGRVEGRVVGSDGAPVAGASVKLNNPGRGGGPTLKTDKKGKK